MASDIALVTKLSTGFGATLRTGFGSSRVSADDSLVHSCTSSVGAATLQTVTCSTGDLDAMWRDLDLRGVIDLKVVVEMKQQRADSGSGLGLVLELACPDRRFCERVLIFRWA